MEKFVSKLFRLTISTRKINFQTWPKINNGCENSTLDEIEQFRLIDEPLSDTILNAVAEQMRFSEDYANGKFFMDGLTNVLGADETVDPDQTRVALKLIEERQNLDDLMLRANHNQEIGGVQVLIGCENTWQELREWSIILTRYGVPEQMSGTLGILGPPMRMPYGHAINTVRFVGELLSDLISENMVE